MQGFVSPMPRSIPKATRVVLGTLSTNPGLLEIVYCAQLHKRILKVLWTRVPDLSSTIVKCVPHIWMDTRICTGIQILELVRGFKYSNLYRDSNTRTCTGIKYSMVTRTCTGIQRFVTVLPLTSAMLLRIDYSFSTTLQRFVWYHYSFSEIFIILLVPKNYTPVDPGG